MAEDTYYVNVHTHDETDEKNVFSIISYRIGEDKVRTDIPYTCGIHPWDTMNVDINCIRPLINNNENLYGIGEIGLDYYNGQKNRNIQILYFTKQLEIAVELSKVAVIHCVKAYDDMLAILADYMPKLRGAIIHSFIGDTVLAKKLTDMGAYLSFSPRSLKSPKTIEALKAVPADLIFIENDESGEDIIQIYESAAQKMGIETERLKEIVWNNFKTLFEV